MSNEEYVGNGLWRQGTPGPCSNYYNGGLQQITPEIQEQQLKIQRDLGLLPAVQTNDGMPDGVFIQIIGGRPVVSIRCSDSEKLTELTLLAKRIMDAVR